MKHALPLLLSLPLLGAVTADPARQALDQAMARMHAAMMVPPSGSADRDFALGMIPHHQGAIDMAKVELRYGTDPELRRLAEAILAAQQPEIAQMQDWLAAHPAAPAPAAAAPDHSGHH